MSEQHLLLIDDDIALCELLSEYLTSEGYTVASANNGEAGIEYLKHHTVDAAIVDVMMPGMSGFDVLREMRTFTNTPALMLTARGEEVDRIVGLEMGADDYVGKPCNPREIVARIRAILRRSAAPVVENSESCVVVDNVEIRSDERAVLHGGVEVDLTSTEFDVLLVLMRDAGHVVSKAKVSELALGRKLGPHDRSIDMHVSRLRKKLGDGSDGNERIKTVRGTGYLLVKPRTSGDVV